MDFEFWFPLTVHIFLDGDMRSHVLPYYGNHGILMLKGAELILVPNACPMEINRLSQLRSRAYENMTAIATCNYPETLSFFARQPNAVTKSL